MKSRTLGLLLDAGQGGRTVSALLPLSTLEQPVARALESW